ncbi:SDR family oxidoreductase [Halorussus ruber]|uniref:SDR family oxidoreductase n=1 Tax=Halorussus ruber TaxID=1126238 RepID=UPI001092AA88|nr:SDR family oxidoreductase [Halorussus ruber]
MASADGADSTLASKSVFLTGFPGFLGSELVARLLERYADDVTIRCLVQPKYRALAEERAVELEGGTPERIELHEGDITESDLGLGAAYDDLADDAVEVYHLAAVYDLGVAREVGMAVNVEGTKNVLDFAESCPDLERFQYVSTCYVSGRHDGVFTHEDLDVGQEFNNYYEETKFLAEVEVQRRMDAGLPATIYRPAITVGDSRTGQTQKYDGPYYILRLLDSLPANLGVVPAFGNPRDYEVNVVPRNFVVDAIDRLSGLDASEGEVYQLCDPNPPTVAGMLRTFEDATGEEIRSVGLPRASADLLRRSLDGVPGLADLLGVEPEVLRYFVHPTSYTSQNAIRDLRGTGVGCPAFESYADALVDFYRAHPEISPEAMV